MEKNKYDKILLKLLINFMKVHGINKKQIIYKKINNLYNINIIKPFNDVKKLKEWHMTLFRFTNFNIKSELITLLTKYSLYEEFIQNMIKFNKFNTIDELINNDKTYIALLIDAAFIWNQTEEGYYLWHDVDELWRKKVNEKYDQIKLRWDDELL